MNLEVMSVIGSLGVDVNLSILGTVVCNSLESNTLQTDAHASFSYVNDLSKFPPELFFVASRALIEYNQDLQTTKKFVLQSKIRGRTYSKFVNLDNLNNQVVSDAQITLGDYDKYLKVNNLLTIHTQANIVASHKQPRILNSIRAEASTRVINAVVVSRHVDAYFKYRNSMPPHAVTGWYNGRMVFGSHRDIYSAGLRTKVNAQASAATHFIRGINDLKNSLSIEFNEEVYAKHLNNLILKNKISSISANIMVSNISPYKDTEELTNKINLFAQGQAVSEANELDAIVDSLHSNSLINLLQFVHPIHPKNELIHTNANIKTYIKDTKVSQQLINKPLLFAQVKTEVNRILTFQANETVNLTFKISLLDAKIAPYKSDELLVQTNTTLYNKDSFTKNVFNSLIINANISCYFVKNEFSNATPDMLNVGTKVSSIFGLTQQVADTQNSLNINASAITPFGGTFAVKDIKEIITQTSNTLLRYNPGFVKLPDEIFSLEMYATIERDMPVLGTNSVMISIYESVAVLLKEAKELFNSIGAHIQSDIQYGNDLLLSRTESLIVNASTQMSITKGYEDIANHILDVFADTSALFGIMQTVSYIDSIILANEVSMMFGLVKEPILNNTITTNALTIYDTAPGYEELPTNNLDVTAQSNIVFGNVLETVSLNNTLNINHFLTIFIKDSMVDALFNNAVLNANIAIETQHRLIITLDNKNAGTSGTQELIVLQNESVTPESITIPTKDFYDFKGYFISETPSAKQSWATFAIQKLARSHRILFDDFPSSTTDINNKLFLKTLYEDNTKWRVHAVIKSSHPASFDLCDSHANTHFIDVTKQGDTDYTYIIDSPIIERLANYFYPSGSENRHEFLDVNTDSDAVVSVSDMLAYVSENNLQQVIDEQGNFLQIASDTFNWHTTLYALWTPRKVKVIWRSYSNYKEEWVHYNSSYTIMPHTSYAPAGTPDTDQYDYSWPQPSYSITDKNITPNSKVYIYEQRAVKQYSIIWKRWNGQIISNTLVEWGTTVNAPALTPNSVGYTYSWPQESVVVKQNTTIQEIQTINQYTVTWEFASGEQVSDTKNWNTTSYAPDNTPTNNYNYYSWPVASTTVDGDKTIKENTHTRLYNIKFIRDDNTQIIVQTPYDQMPTIPANTANTVKYTYTWPTVSAVTGDTTYNEIRTTNKYNITWKYFNGEIAQVNNAEYDSYVNAPSLQTANTNAWIYYWSVSSVLVKGNQTINELRQGKEYTISFNSDGSTPNPVSKTVRYNDPYGTLPVVTKTEKQFIGWRTTSQGGEKVLAATLMLKTYNHTLYSRWNPTVTYNHSNQIGTDVIFNIVYGHNRYPNSSNTLSIGATTGIESRTVFNITLSKQLGTGGTDTITGWTGESITPASTTKPTYSNYVFQGYYTQPNMQGTKLINADGSYNSAIYDLIGNHILYAGWAIRNIKFATLIWSPEDGGSWYRNDDTGVKRDIYVGDILTTVQAEGTTIYAGNSSLYPADKELKLTNFTQPHPGWQYSHTGYYRMTGGSTTLDANGYPIISRGFRDLSTETDNYIAITTWIKPIVYNVIINQNGGGGASASPNTYTPHSLKTRTITLTKGTRLYYRFSHWEVSGANGKASLSGNVITLPMYKKDNQVYGNINVKPIWLPASATGNNSITLSALIVTPDVVNKVIITLDKRGGDGGTDYIESVAGHYINPTSVVMPTKRGYIFFAYWETIGGESVKRINSSGVYIALDNSTFSADTSLWASYTNRSYWVRFKPLNYNVYLTLTGEDIYSSKTLYAKYVELTNAQWPYSYPDIQWTKTGYTLTGFKLVTISGELDGYSSGWTLNYTYSTGTSIYNRIGDVDFDLVFTPNTYTVTFIYNNGNANTTKTVTYDSTYGTLPTPLAPVDKKFVGWYNSDGSKITSSTIVNTPTNHVLEARWVKTKTDSVSNTIEITSRISMAEQVAPTYTVTVTKDSNITSIDSTTRNYKSSFSEQIITLNKNLFNFNLGYSISKKSIDLTFVSIGGNDPYMSTPYTLVIPEGYEGNINIHYNSLLNDPLEEETVTKINQTTGDTYEARLNVILNPGNYTGYSIRFLMKNRLYRRADMVMALPYWENEDYPYDTFYDYHINIGGSPYTNPDKINHNSNLLQIMYNTKIKQPNNYLYINDYTIDTGPKKEYLTGNWYDRYGNLITESRVRGCIKLKASKDTHTLLTLDGLRLFKKERFLEISNAGGFSSSSKGSEHIVEIVDPGGNVVKRYTLVIKSMKTQPNKYGSVRLKPLEIL